MPVQFASLVVGVDEYPENFYQPGESRLLCATADARTFHEWMLSVSALEEVRLHRLLCNHEATFDAITSALDDIATEIRPQESVLIYLAGHGRRDSNGGWFCPVDEGQGKQRIDGRLLDAFLNRVRSKHYLVVLDCCYAAAVLSNSSFFSDLGEARSKHFIAACGAHQLAYEDERLRPRAEPEGSSLLSTAIFEILHQAQEENQKQIGVEDIVFPYLKQRVPTLAFRLKGRAAQEPVVGGSSSERALIPVTASRWSPPSTFEALTRRWRSIVGATALVAMIGVLIAYWATWHLEISARGKLALFAGPSWLPALPGDLLIRAELPLSVDDLTSDSRLRAAALSRSIQGVWWQLDDRGRRRWAQSLTEVLKHGVVDQWLALQSAPLTAAPKWWALFDPETIDFNSSGYATMTMGQPDSSGLVALSVARALGQEPVKLADMIDPVIQNSHLARFETAACAKPIRLEYVDWHKGDFWDAIALWVRTEDSAGVFKFLLFEARALDLIFMSEPPRAEDPRIEQADYLINTLQKFRHVVRSYVTGLAERGKPFCRPTTQKSFPSSLPMVALSWPTWSTRGLEWKRRTPHL